LIPTENLQGFVNERDLTRKSPFRQRKTSWTLRNHGVTLRKTIDTVIATRCIESGYELLHNDKDFDPFAKHLGLRVA
jgi:predicted nucleic acid-binding protein